MKIVVDYPNQPYRVTDSNKGDGEMTDEQKDFIADIKEVSQALAQWVEDNFEAGFSVAEVKQFIKDAAKVAGRN